MVPVRLPLFGPSRAEGPMGPLPLRRKALGILYYLALEGPTRRERLADLLWGHRVALQNLRSELTHLRSFFGKEAFRGPVLTLPPGVELDRTPGSGEAMEGLEDLSPAFADWVYGWRTRLAPGEEGTPFPKRLEAVRPPALVILIGPPGSGQESLAQALAQKLGLLLRHGLGEGAGVFYLSEPFPPKEVGLALKPLPGRVLVVARSSFGEDPSFLLALRTRFPAEVTVVEQVPCLSWREAVGGPLRHLPFAEAARFYLRSGGRVEVLRELLAMGNPEALPQRVRAMVALEARHLPWEARKALEVLALHPGPFPEKLAWILGYGEALDELEHRGWLLYCEGRYRFSEPQFRPYLTAGFGEGERCRLHARLAEAWEALGDPVAAAYHRFYGEKGEALKAAQLGSWRQALAAHPGPNVPLPRSRVRKGKKRALETEEIHLVSFQGEVAEAVLELEEPLLLHLQGEVYQELPLGLGANLEAFPFRLRSLKGEGAVYFLPRANPGYYPWGAVLPQENLDHEFLLRPGQYLLELGTPGVVSLRLQAWETAPGNQEILVPLEMTESL